MRSFQGWPKFDIEVHTEPDRDRTTYMLIVRQLQESDSGFYTCQVVVKGADQQSGNVLITIQKDGLLTVLGKHAYAFITLLPGGKGA